MPYLSYVFALTAQAINLSAQLLRAPAQLRRAPAPPASNTYIAFYSKYISLHKLQGEIVCPIMGINIIHKKENQNKMLILNVAQTTGLPI